MTTKGRARLNVGLIGVGRLGRVYARDLATRIPSTRLTAVADVAEDLAAEVAREFDVPRSYGKPADIFDDANVDAVVIVSPTRTHCELTQAAAARRKPIFCEKPAALSLEEVLAMKETINNTGVFFQLGFMRRFDRGYAAAKRQIEAGAIGDVVVFRATSRDTFPPSAEYANPKNSGHQDGGKSGDHGIQRGTDPLRGGTLRLISGQKRDYSTFDPAHEPGSIPAGYGRTRPTARGRRCQRSEELGAIV